MRVILFTLLISQILYEYGVKNQLSEYRFVFFENFLCRPALFFAIDEYKFDK
jgi:hypothetical protein